MKSDDELRAQVIRFVREKRKLMTIVDLRLALRTNPREHPDDRVWKRALEIFEDLHHRGVIMHDHTQDNIAFWELTSAGELAVEREDLLAIDPDAFPAQAQVDAPNVDALAFEYLSEAVRCWKQHLPRAAVVMLGVSMEVASLDLAEELVWTFAESHLDKWRGTIGASARWKRAWELTGAQLRPALMPLLEHPGSRWDRETAGRSLTELEGVQNTLLAISRFHRDDSGHALVPDVDESMVGAFLRAAPRAFEVMSDVSGLLDEYAINTKGRRFPMPAPGAPQKH